MPVSYVFTSANGSTTYDNQSLPSGSAMVDSNGQGLLNLVVTISGSDYTDNLGLSVRSNSANKWLWFAISKNGNNSLLIATPQNTADGTNRGTTYYLNDRSTFSDSTINDTASVFASSVVSYASDHATLTFNNFVFYTANPDNHNALSSVPETTDISSLSLKLWSQNVTFGTTSFQTAHATAMYLGPMFVSQSSVDFHASTLVNAKAPSAPNQLVPKAYVDKYVSDTAHYFQDLIAKTNGRDMMDRISSLELQLERLYQALFKISRDTAVVVVSDGNGGLANLSYSFASDVQAPTDLVITVPPSAPVPAAITF